MSISDRLFEEPARSAPAPGRMAGALLLLLIAAAAWSCSPGSRVGPAEGLRRMGRGIGLLEQYDYSGAYKIFSGLCESFPAWEAAWTNRGIAGLNLQDESKCVPNMKKALELNPRSSHALLVLGFQYEHLQRTDEALELFRNVVELDPDDPHGH